MTCTSINFPKYIITDELIQHTKVANFTATLSSPVLLTSYFINIDPRILQDVQRALKLKARREARLKQKNVVGPNFIEPTGQPQTPPSNLFPFSPKLPPSPSSLPSSRKLSISAISDVDFSPSTAIPEFFVQPSHPIPSSLDNGITLDWTGALADDADKRWSISIGKKKEKDKLPPLGPMIDQQDQLYKGELKHYFFHGIIILTSNFNRKVISD